MDFLFDICSLVIIQNSVFSNVMNCLTWWTLQLFLGKEIPIQKLLALFGCCLQGHGQGSLNYANEKIGFFSPQYTL
jgi:hypothetical protein